jgi:thiol-disulfide isomerase/thioredoxin
MLFAVFITACSSPEFELVDGRNKSLSEYQGQWLLINYWAVWCKPCVTEIPEFNELNRRRGVAVISYNYDNTSGDLLAQQVAELGIEFPILRVDPAQVFSQDMPSALPATMLIDPEGRFDKWLMGPQTLDGILKLIN